MRSVFGNVFDGSNQKGRLKINGGFSDGLCISWYLFAVAAHIRCGGK